MEWRKYNKTRMLFQTRSLFHYIAAKNSFPESRSKTNVFNRKYASNKLIDSLEIEENKTFLRAAAITPNTVGAR